MRKTIDYEGLEIDVECDVVAKDRHNLLIFIDAVSIDGVDITELLSPFGFEKLAKITHEYIINEIEEYEVERFNWNYRKD